MLQQCPALPSAPLVQHAAQPAAETFRRLESQKLLPKTKFRAIQEQVTQTHHVTLTEEASRARRVTGRRRTGAGEEHAAVHRSVQTHQGPRLNRRMATINNKDVVRADAPRTRAGMAGVCHQARCLCAHGNTPLMLQPAAACCSAVRIGPRCRDLAG